MNWNKSKGKQYEDQAREYLVQRGLTLLNQNYHCRFGEIDLIMLQQGVLCFIEVKFRANMGFGGAASAIPLQKQKKIVKTALFFIAQNTRLAQHAMRFDAFLIQRRASNQNHNVNWIQNAFYAE
ncbi:MAG: YraN family protein [Gammaproteobacteria bacterium]|jgi:putative endonuclease|nr:YraN family protein [Gammaproteobacteria bacterium]MCZ6487777.1 YraN family protein [Gammaproteobacteria bacterium]MCZ6579717.1 YraN family protein [Gammaproteobacteria bacterium]MCZ6668223.1 YraN family protein [Gammaproteobacteria bacterium]MCZ6722927.1 YraN family protein [Gammaproteobacteria bacterium]